MYLGDPTGTVEHPLSPELSQGVMPSQQCRNSENVTFPRSGLCVGHRLCPFAQEQQNTSGIYFLLYMSEDSRDRSKLRSLCKWRKDKAMINLVCYAKLCF